MKRALIIVLAVLFADQFLKMWVKTHMFAGEEINVLGDWFIIHFTENKGMAFGLEFGGDYGKLALSLFRVLAVTAIGYYMLRVVKQGAHKGLVSSMALIFAGAIGNIIDSLFYGPLFSCSAILSDPGWCGYGTVAEFGDGYAGMLHGNVVDMLYFPMFEGRFPDWFPIWKNEPFLFFRPVFNIADSAITVGVALIILFQKRFFASLNKKKEDELLENEGEESSEEAPETTPQSE